MHVGVWFQQRIIDTGRLPLFCFLVALIVTFLFTRVNVRLIRARIGWFRDVSVGDVHVHHVVFGVVLMLLGGVAGLVVAGLSSGWYALTAGLFGVGAALVLDEFALILHLRDVYWTEEGRASVDAVFVAVAVTVLLLLGMRPFSLPDPSHVGRWPAVLLLTADLFLAVVTLLKGKIWTGLAGLFVPVLLIFGALRLARPGSPWARWLFAPGARRPHPVKMARAEHREIRWRRPVIRVKIAVQEFVSGRHDLPSAWPRADRGRTSPATTWGDVAARIISDSEGSGRGHSPPK
ncbi:membrane protein [Sphaerisporangium siamense]|nr:membrane protein [Sphaerisporangium siamense]